MTQRSYTPLRDLPRRSGGDEHALPGGRVGGLSHISEVIQGLDLPADVMAVIRSATDEPGLPLGWEGIEVVE